MKPLILKLRKQVLFDATCWVLCIQLPCQGALWAEESSREMIAADVKNNSSEEKYTINFQNISMLEYVKFISKIAGVNFIFNEQDLQFNVTIVSEEPVTVKNIMSTLIQVLRIHDLNLLEQENNLVISRSTTVSQISTIQSGDLPGEEMNTQAPIVTRVFRLKNASPASVASIIRSMTSASAIIEISNETKQLIVTDITTNIEKIAALLLSLDAPHTNLDVDSYVVKYISPSDLVSLVTQIVSPFAEGNPLIFVPQLDTNTIFIVSTPYLIERSLAVMTDIDVPPKAKIGGRAAEAAELFIYKIENQPADDLLKAITKVSTDLKGSAQPPIKLIQSLDSVKYIPESNSLMFTADPETIEKIKNLMANLDSARQKEAAETFYIYKSREEYRDKVDRFLTQIINNLNTSQPGNADLIKTLKKAKWVSETQSYLFQGSPASIATVKELMKTFEIQENLSPPGRQTFYVYELKYTGGDFIINSLQGIAKRLEETPGSDPAFIQALKSAKWMKENNTIMITGSQESVDGVKQLIAQFDISAYGAQAGSEAATAKTFYIYDLKNVSGLKVEQELKKIAAKVKKQPSPNVALVRSLENITWIEETNSILITGSPEIIDQIKSFIAQLDIGGVGKTSFFIYKPVNVSAKQVQSSLHGIYQNLKTSGLVDPELLEALETVQYVSTTDSLLFTGTPGALDKVRALLEKIDVVATGAQEPTKVENITFYIYHIEHVPANQLIDSLKTVASDLEHSNLTDKAIAQSIMGMKLIKENNSLLFTGAPETLQRIEEIVKRFDQPGMAPLAPTAPSTAPSTAPTTAQPEQQTITQIAQTMREVVSQFAIYKPQYVSGEQLIAILQDFKRNLLETNVLDKSLYDAIDNLRWIPKTQSLLISGSPDAIKRIEDLLRQFDVPSVANPETPEKPFVQATNFLVYKLQYQKGDEIQAAIKKIGASLMALPNGVKDPLTDSISSLQWIEVTNSLLTSGDSESLQKIKHLIENLDIPLKQVLIEVLVIETTMLNGQTFGLEWIGQGQYKNKLSSSFSNIPTAQDNPFITGFTEVNPQVGPSPSNIPILSGFDLGVIGNLLFHKGQSFATLSSLVNALQSDIDSTIIMNPKIVTQDNKSASIFIGRNIPFVGSVVTSTIAEQVTTTSLEYRNIGVSLTITPVLGDSDLVTLEIVNEISSAPATPPTTETGQVNGIVTTQTTMNTRVHVPNEHFLILSGMIQDTKDHSKVGIPCLGGLPIIGAAFSNNTRNYSKDNLIIFVRPHIINSYEDYKKVTEHQQNLYKDMLPPRSLKESFDMGIDLLKSYKDE